MRKGFNPNKDKVLVSNSYFHQVVIPVYIPNEKDYFKDSFQILKLCLNSLFKTCHSNTFITVVNNGSNSKIMSYLDELLSIHKIHELIHTTNVGKLNAILKGIAGHRFDLVTITDSDVLFLDNWQRETYKVFKAIPKSGVVSPVPSSKVLKQNTSNIIFENIFSKRLRFLNIQNPKAMKMFAKSIGNNEFYKKVHLNKALTIEIENVRAIIGAGHFVATYRGSILNKKSQNFSKYSLGGDSETELLDKPSVNLGLWRLSTANNYAYHLGNVKEDWMCEFSEDQTIDKNYKVIIRPKLKEIKVSSFNVIFKKIVFNKLILNRFIWECFLRYKG